MPIARCITRYCITMKEDHQFANWGLQASHDAISWITLHVGNAAFVGRSCFNINNTRFYEYYRVKVYRWIGVAGIPELDFYEKADDHTTTSSSYTTTTSTTSISSSTTTSHTHTTTTTRSTTLTTIPPVYSNPSYVTLSGTALNYELVWQSSSVSTYYEIQVRYNNESYSPFLFTSTNIYQGQDIPSSANSIQFRVRYHIRDTITSDWTESNILILPKVTVDFKVSFQGIESSSFLRVSRLGQRVQLTDLSYSSHGDIVSWEWTFYTDNLGKSIHNVTSSLENPHYTYITAGLYAIGLTVTDSTGRSNTLIKTNFVEVGCQIVANFMAIDINGNECYDYIEAPYGASINFVDMSGPNEVVSRHWEFYNSDVQSGLYQTSTLKRITRRYGTTNDYAVGLQVVGSYGQTDHIVKSSFVRVSKDSSTTTTTTTWATTTHSTSTSTTGITTVTTTSPPDNWLRIPMRGGAPLCDSYEIGFEPYRAFDDEVSTEWVPIYSATTATTTTLTSTTTVITTTTTTDYFLTDRDTSLFWTPDTDIADFRQRFIRLVTPDNVYKIRVVDGLPPYNSRYRGMVVYEMYSEKYYVGLESSWSQINPEYVLHVLTHTNSVDQILKVGDQPPEEVYPGVIWITPDSTTTTISTTTTTTATTMWLGNESLIGVGNYPQCSSFSVGHECTSAFDGDDLTYWEAENKVTETSPEWLGFYWTTSKMIKWYKFFCGTVGTPMTWSLIASKNGITWVTIDYRYLESIVGWNWFAVDNSTDYYFYRFLFYKTSDDNKPRVSTLEMYQSVVTTTTSTESTATTTGPP